MFVLMLSFQVPLLDASVLDQLCLSDELWAKLDYPDVTNSTPTMLITYKYSYKGGTHNHKNCVQLLNPLSLGMTLTGLCKWVVFSVCAAPESLCRSCMLFSRMVSIVFSECLCYSCLKLPLIRPLSGPTHLCVHFYAHIS